MAERVFAMPDLGEGLEEGRVVSWLVTEGDEVALNQPLVEVETAKAVVEIPSPFAGTVARLHAAIDEDVPVGSALVTFTVADGGPVSSGVRATPAIRKLAKELGVELPSVVGTGHDGRVGVDDVRAAAGPSVHLDADRVELTPTRRAIAANLERQAAIPHVTTFRTADCTALEGFRSSLGVSPLPVVVAAIAAIVGEHRSINASWGGDHVDVHRSVHVGIATDTERGLVVPVVRDAHTLGIAALAEQIRSLAEQARAGTLPPDRLAAATIAVSNTGSYGSEAGTPILAPGTAVTLAIGVIAPRALVVAGDVVARPAVTLSMTFDHRVLDGGAAGRALTALVALLESAERLGGLPR